MAPKNSFSPNPNQNNQDLKPSRKLIWRMILVQKLVDCGMVWCQWKAASNWQQANKIPVTQLNSQFNQALKTRNLVNTKFRIVVRMVAISRVTTFWRSVPGLTSSMRPKLMAKLIA